MFLFLLSCVSSTNLFNATRWAAQESVGDPIVAVDDSLYVLDKDLKAINISVDSDLVDVRSQSNNILIESGRTLGTLDIYSRKNFTFIDRLGFVRGVSSALVGDNVIGVNYNTLYSFYDRVKEFKQGKEFINGVRNIVPFNNSFILVEGPRQIESDILPKLSAKIYDDLFKVVMDKEIYYLTGLQDPFFTRMRTVLYGSEIYTILWNSKEKFKEASLELFRYDTSLDLIEKRTLESGRWESKDSSFLDFSFTTDSMVRFKDSDFDLLLISYITPGKDVKLKVYDVKEELSLIKSEHIGNIMSFYSAYSRSSSIFLRRLEEELEINVLYEKVLENKKMIMLSKHLIQSISPKTTNSSTSTSSALESTAIDTTIDLSTLNPTTKEATILSTSTSSALESSTKVSDYIEETTTYAETNSEDTIEPEVTTLELKNKSSDAEIIGGAIAGVGVFLIAVGVTFRKYILNALKPGNKINPYVVRKVKLDTIETNV